jgi:hypothetical protein
MKTLTLILFILSFSINANAQKVKSFIKSFKGYSLERVDDIIPLALTQGVMTGLYDLRSKNDANYNALFGGSKWMNQDSHRNKWRYDREGNRRERFPGSSTIFVALTDFDHFAELNTRIVIPGLIGSALGKKWYLCDKKVSLSHKLLDAVIIFTVNSLIFNSTYYFIKAS